ncbi:MAG: sugar phosphate isomerase/epimerase [Phycisphaerales bacterium]|nr:sugar phosphate isomerase/epimerase [Phycisphaerales bacterium]
MNADRRTVNRAIAATALLGPTALASDPDQQKDPILVTDSSKWPISLAQWSLHRKHHAGELKAEDFPAYSADTFDIRGVEYVNSFFKDKSTDEAWLSDLNRRCRDAGVTSVLIMVDGEGALGDPDETKRMQAVDNHRRWLGAAKHLGCHAIRVNVPSAGTPEQQRDLCADGLAHLCEHADKLDLNVVIENHGGLSSNGAWLAALVQKVNHKRLGTLPDFGNFVLDWSTMKMYDRYKGMDELLPHAKALSAKSHEFDDEGNEIFSDYGKMFELVRKQGYEGWVGVEYEGPKLSEDDGIKATRDLLIRHGCTLTVPAASS